MKIIRTQILNFPEVNRESQSLIKVLKWHSKQITIFFFIKFFWSYFNRMVSTYFNITPKFRQWPTIGKKGKYLLTKYTILFSFFLKLLLTWKFIEILMRNSVQKALVLWFVKVKIRIKRKFLLYLSSHGKWCHAEQKKHHKFYGTCFDMKNAEFLETMQKAKKRKAVKISAILTALSWIFLICCWEPIKINCIIYRIVLQNCLIGNRHAF